jgi:hypothetical protein
MITEQGQGSQQAPATTTKPLRNIIGMVLMFLGTALIGYGTHFLARTGTCSGTGYTEYGPVPKCGGGEALYIMSAFFIGPLIAGIGWLFTQVSGLLWPMLCVCVGIGLVLIHADHTASVGARAAAMLTGEFLFALAVLSVVVTIRKRLRKARLGAP